MNRKTFSFKMFIAAIATFMTLELADSPLRSLSYLSVLAVAGGNMWIKAEKIVNQRISSIL